MSITSRTNIASIIKETDPLQLIAMASVLIVDVLGLAIINRRKCIENDSKKGISWTTKRNAYWVLITCFVSSASSYLPLLVIDYFLIWKVLITCFVSSALMLDAFFKISPALIPAKAYIFSNSTWST